MRVHLDNTKTWTEKAQTVLENNWPKIYRVTNGVAQSIFSNLVNFLRSILSQLSGKRKIIS